MSAVAVLLVSACAGAGRPTLSADTAPPRACSADGMVVPQVDGEGVAPGAAATRQAVIEAALDCDYDALGVLATAGALRVVLDGVDVPATDWERQEAEGVPILRPVAGILSLTPAVAADDGSVTWPSAVDWPFSDVAPGDERQALVDVVGEDGVFGWAETGGYAGWRTTITADGAWSTLTLGPTPG